MTEDNRKVCPFRSDVCLEDKCALWTQIQMAMLSPLGVATGKPVSMCVFLATLMVTGSPKPPVQQIPLPNLRQQ